MLIDLQVAAIRRKAGKADRRGIVDQLERRLMREQHDFGLMPRSRYACRKVGTTGHVALTQGLK
jgi:hypothetical protein